MKSHDPSIFPDRLTVLTENIETFMVLFQNKHVLKYFKYIEDYITLIYYTDQQNFCKEDHAIFFSFEFDLNSTNNDNELLRITHFVNLFADTLAQANYNEKQKEDFKKNRVMYERTKMEEFERQEIEDKERRDFIEQWKMKNKLKGKKPTKKKVNDKKIK